MYTRINSKFKEFIRNSGRLVNVNLGYDSDANLASKEKNIDKIFTEDKILISSI
jgi:hypothetical protein